MGATRCSLDTMGGPKSKSLKDIRNGAILQMLEAVTLGMPFEVWKTRMGRFRNESTMESFRAVYNSGGIGQFWQGTGPKMIESATKGGVLLLSKETIKDSSIASGINPAISG